MSTPQAKSPDELMRAIRGHGGWCFWIAALTAINAALAMGGSDKSFLVGTFVAQILMYLPKEAGPEAAPVLQFAALAFNAGVIGFFVAMGILARKAKRWAFALAFLAYGLDTLVLLPAASEMLLGIVFHVWALFSLGMGYVAVGALRKAQAAEAALAALPGGAPPPLPPVIAPGEVAKIDDAAREMEELFERLYAPKHDRRPVNPQDFKVDHAYYDRTLRWLEGQGFRHLGDYEQADLKGTPADPGCFQRVAASSDGVVLACVFHFRPAKWWLRALIWIMSRGGLKGLDLQTEFSDGSFVSTGNMPLAARAKHPPQMHVLQLPAKTAHTALLAKHLERVALFLQERPQLNVRAIHTLEQANASEDRQDKLKAAFRRDVGGITREEIFAHADSALKKEAAEKLWQRIQERKQAGAAVKV